MPLRITLKPNERLVINGASIRNGDRSTSFVIETQARFLRESEILREEDADTAARRILFTLQALYMTEPDERGPLQATLLGMIAAFVAAAPSATPIVAEIAEALSADRHHVAIKRARGLVEFEDALLDRAAA